ncbi:hypothetical protein ACFQ6Q_04340 [Streptomyces sp. NPDC056437]|uniref:hypothetical protein n=1 Tax=Streptomyces sp. NPDC056437 TaxID=3345816 RepID=UPI00367D208E
MRAGLTLLGILAACCATAALAGHYLIIRPAERRHRAQRVTEQRAARIADINARLRRGPVPAADDNAAGFNLADQKECERLWSAPFDPQTGLELLRRDWNRTEEQ